MPTILPRFLTFFQALLHGFADHPPGARPPAALVLRLQRFLNWTAKRLPRALHRARHGYTPPPPRPPRTASSPKSERAQATSALPLPRREGWLLRATAPDRCHIVAAYGAGLEQLLSDPDLAPLLASPPVHRLLRPLCRMLGISRCLPPSGRPQIEPPQAAPAALAAPSPIHPATASQRVPATSPAPAHLRPKIVPA